ncbi:TIGR04028 family ABC transporter substrate-binding protein [Corynebacterium yudongzhengii]|uniref:TIGR04028 family ABC transporter substrate-binding protein n=1 Tax=Corynebacterium yudongzhengii TaxID=2080740 RepID=UPI0026784536
MAIHKRGLRSALGAIVASVLVAVSVSACSSEPERGITYVEPNMFNSLYPPSGGYYPNGGVLNNIADRLLWQHPETLELHPWIATELPEINEDATEFTFTLREDVTYSDGTKLDAENVAANYDLYGFGDPDRALTPSDQLGGYEGAEVLDDYTVRFHFDRPSPGFPQATSTMNQALLSTPTLENGNTGFSPGNAENISGSGPFVITDEELGTGLTLSAREDYDWAPPARTDHQGPAEVEEIRFTLAEEDSVRTGSLVAEQSDIARQIEAPDERHLIDQGINIHSAGTNGVNNAYHFHFRQPLMEDQRVRQAIIHAIDRENILNTLYSQSYPAGTSILAANALGYREQDGAYSFDPERSRELLDDAGWQIGEDGVRVRDGERLSVTFNEAVPQPRSREMFTKVQEKLRDVGIEAELNPGDRTAQQEAMQDLERIQVRHTMVGRASYDTLPNWLDVDGRNSFLNGWEDTVGDEEMQQMVDDYFALVDEDKRAAAVGKMQDYLTEHALVLPMFEEPQVYGFRDTISGFSTEAIGRPSFYAVRETGGEE